MSENDDVTRRLEEVSPAEAEEVETEGTGSVSMPGAGTLPEDVDAASAKDDSGHSGRP